MNVTLIGSGNVATVLGRKIIQSGHTVRQVYSRDIAHASNLANELSASGISELGLVQRNSDLYIVAISDDSLYKLNKHLLLIDEFVVHTAGSVPMNVLSQISSSYGILYPLQSLRKELKTPPVIPLLVDANSEINKLKLTEFAGSISEQVFHAGDEKRKNYILQQ